MPFHNLARIRCFADQIEPALLDQALHRCCGQACFALKLLPGVQFGREARRSENIESFKTTLSEEL
jgi:hypothetical protein